MRARPSMRRALPAALLAASAALGLAACGENGAAPSPAAEAVVDLDAAAARIRADMAYLADDARAGRETGSEGYAEAAAYVAEQFARMDLSPGGVDGDWFQPVEFVRAHPVLDAALLAVGDGAPFAHLEDYVILGSPRHEAVELDAEAVFVGYGLDAPEEGFEDYAGVDVTGKIAVVLGGAPDGVEGEKRAHLVRSKTKVASDKGAVGLVFVPTAAWEARRSFESRASHADRPALAWVGPDGRAHADAPNLRAAAVLSEAGAGKLFEGAEADYATIRAAASEPGPIAGFPLPTRVRLSQRTRMERIESENVAGILPGSDPARRGEYVVMSAHLDHVGPDETLEGDQIRNGALDNAAGVATMLEAARQLAAAETAPARSVLFLAVTGEEHGLLGSDYFARFPTVPDGAVVADINLDMPLILYEFEEAIAFGADRSSLGPLAREAAAGMDVEIIPDPVPEMNLFVRSDHYSFVRQGVPSLFLFLGFGESAGETFPDFMGTHYHQPSDDLALPIDYRQGARFAELNRRIVRAVADAKARPSWNDGDFFGDTFGGARE